MPNVEELLDQLRDEGVEDSTVSALEDEFQNQRASSLRKKMSEQAKRISELESVEAKFKALESVPHRKAALAKANVDYDALPKAIRALVDKELSEFDDEEKVSSFVSEYELPTSSGEQTQTPTGAEAIQNHGRQQAPASAGAGENREAELKKFLDADDIEGFTKYSQEHPADTPEWA
jgi:hypothetical protein